MFAFARHRHTRRPSLTPMIDVVFLLLVFFMLAARFGQDSAIPIATAGQGQDYSGPPRLVEVLPDGQRLNGKRVDQDALLAQIDTLTATTDDTIVLRAGDGADVQRVVDMVELLSRRGYTQVVLVE